MINKNKINKPQFFGTREEIAKWLKKYHIKNCTINDDLSVDVNGDVDISRKNLKTIPIKFGKITGDFCCDENRLISLVGAPETVGGGLNCNYNKLTNLSGSPVLIAGNFWCNENKLTSLADFGPCIRSSSITFPSVRSPKTVGGSFACLGSALTSLLEIISCDFKETFYFNIDENNFQQKELIQILKKYYDSGYKCYKLTNRQFNDTIKPVLEKEILQEKLIKNGNSTKIKNVFI